MPEGIHHSFIIILDRIHVMLLHNFLKVFKARTHSQVFTNICVVFSYNLKFMCTSYTLISKLNICNFVFDKCCPI